MTQTKPSKSISRRDFFKLAGGALAVTAGMYAIPAGLRKMLQPETVVQAAPGDAFDLFFAGTDGWISMPPSSPAIVPFFPDDLAPAPFNTYVFGFRNVTGLPDVKVQGQKMKAQHMAPLFWVKEYDPNLGAYPLNNEFRLRLTNLGLQMRPDLTDAHTLHWHGFRNAIPISTGSRTDRSRCQWGATSSTFTGHMNRALTCITAMLRMSNMCKWV